MPETQVTASSADLLSMYNTGKTLQQIADVFGVTRERIRQKLAKLPEYSRHKKYHPTPEERERAQEMARIAEFWMRVDKSGGPDACWNYRGCLYPSGYGHCGLTFSDNRGYAHRAAYEFSVGPIPDGREVCHKCNNRACCNPAHLYAGTHKQNMRDREERYARGELDITKRGWQHSRKSAAVAVEQGEA